MMESNSSESSTFSGTTGTDASSTTTEDNSDEDTSMNKNLTTETDASSTTTEDSSDEDTNMNKNLKIDVENGMPNIILTNNVVYTEEELNPLIKMCNDMRRKNEYLWELISRVCYGTNLPLNFLENDYWQQLFSELQPSLTLPSQQDLSTHLLDNEYCRVNTILKDKIDDALTIAIDIDCMMDNTINVVLKIPDVVIFKQISVEDDICTNLIAKIIIDTINEIGINRIISIGINKNVNMLELRSLLKNEFSESTFQCYGCCYNTLNMFIEYILQLKILPLCNLRILCEFVATSLNNSHTFRTSFQEDTSNLSWMSDNNCGLVLTAMNDVWKNQVFLETIVEEDPNIINYNCQKVIKDKTFWKDLNLSYNLLLSINDQVKRVQTEGISSIVEVFHVLHNVLDIYDLRGKTSLVLTKLKESKNICVTPIHLAANFLDPHFIGKNLNEEEFETALNFIYEFSQLILKPIDDETTNGIMYEVAIYKAKQNFFSNKFIWEALTDNNGNKLPPKIWWKSICSNSKLSKIAVIILNFNAYIPSIEHSNFTEYSETNNLLKEQIEKLLFINNNLKLVDT